MKRVIVEFSNTSFLAKEQEDDGQWFVDIGTFLKNYLPHIGIEPKPILDRLLLCYPIDTDGFTAVDSLTEVLKGVYRFCTSGEIYVRDDSIVANPYHKDLVFMFDNLPLMTDFFIRGGKIQYVLSGVSNLRPQDKTYYGANKGYARTVNTGSSITDGVLIAIENMSFDTEGSNDDY